MKCRTTDRDATELHWPQHRYGGHDPSATDAGQNLQDPSDFLARRELIGKRPAWMMGGGTQILTCRQVIELDRDARRILRGRLRNT